MSDSYNKDFVWIVNNMDGFIWKLDKDSEVPDGWSKGVFSDVVEGKDV
jgi:hypothetical protein